MKITNSLGISVELKPWTDDGYCKINKIHIVEQLGGELIKGTISLVFTKSEKFSKLITDQQTGTLIIEDTKDNGFSYTIPIFIVSREYLNNFLILNIVGVPYEDSDFFSMSLSTTYTDTINNVIEKLYKPGKLDIRTDSSINSEITIHQVNESDFDLCNRLSLSFKKDIVFAHSFSGLLIKDVIGKDSYGNKEPNINVIGGRLSFPLTGYKLNYSPVINQSPFIPWNSKQYSSVKPINGSSLLNYNTYRIFGKDFGTLMKNYEYNLNFLNSKFYSTLKLSNSDMPNYKLGDTVNYKSASDEDESIKLPFTKYIVASNELFYAVDGSDEKSPNGYGFEIISELWGLDKGKWAEIQFNNIFGEDDTIATNMNGVFVNSELEE